MLFNIKQEELIEKINGAQWIKDSYENMKGLCEPFMDVQRPYDIPAEGANAAAGRSYGARMCMLITVGMVENKAYIDKAVDMLMYGVETGDVAFFENLNGHLAVADGAFTYAVCYDLLKDYLSDEQKEMTEKAMHEFAVYLFECNTTWGLPHSGVSSCNHNSVHFGALGLCALTLNNEEWLARALQRTRDFFANSVDPTGYITEGVSYSNYGFTNALVFSEAYYNHTGIDLVKDYDHFKEIPNQFIEHMLPRYDYLLSLNDHLKYVGNSGPLMYFISRFGYSEALYLWQEFEKTHKTFGSGVENHYNQGIAFPFLIHWANPNLPAVKPSELRRPLSKKFDSGRTMMRTAWDDPMATFVSFTSGKDFHRGHNHPDQNSFTAHALGEDFLIDPGRLGKDSRSHNIVMVNSQGQQFGSSKGEIKAFNDFGRYVQLTGDATEAYIWNPETLIGYAVRHLTFIRYPYPMIIIRDDLQNEHNHKMHYEFMMHTTPDNEFYEKEGALYIKGSHYGNLCRVNMVHPDDVELKIFEKVERQVFHYKQNHDLSKWHKEALFETKAVNPFFTSVITFGETEEELPKISYECDGNTVKMKIQFKDGYTELVDVERFETKVLNGFKDNKQYRPW